MDWFVCDMLHVGGHGKGRLGYPKLKGFSKTKALSNCLICKSWYFSSGGGRCTTASSGGTDPHQPQRPAQGHAAGDQHLHLYACTTPPGPLHPSCCQVSLDCDCPASDWPVSCCPPLDWLMPEMRCSEPAIKPCSKRSQFFNCRPAWRHSMLVFVRSDLNTIEIGNG